MPLSMWSNKVCLASTYKKVYFSNYENAKLGHFRHHQVLNSQKGIEDIAHTLWAKLATNLGTFR